ncbi:MAG: HAMP domain-containing histidine kinase [Nocardioides sp.]|nr:HAMP domain-containing histidine kinase [Nocardioides sp.]
MTLRNRVSVAAAIGVLIVVGSVSGILYVSYAANLGARVDPDLVDAAQQASAIAQKIKEAAGPVSGTVADTKGSATQPGGSTTPVDVGSIQLQVFTPPVVAGEPTRFGPLTARDAAVADGRADAYFTSAMHGGTRFRVYTATLLGSDALVRTSRATNADDGALRNAALLLALLTLTATAATYLIARLAAGRVLRPIGRLTAAAEHVTATRDLTARLGSTSTDEVGRLSASFDTMLAALHDAVVAQRQLVADASHELRTPLTSLTTNLDLLEDGDGLADPQAPALVAAAREQAAELDQLVSDLLDLARYREAEPHREIVRLDLLADDAVHRLRSRAHHVEIETDLRPCLVNVDPAAVHRALTNLVENAVKWSPADSTVRVLVQDGRIGVIDHGPGIPDDDLPHIFERFYRATAARGMPGAGLGLAIVGSVAEANDGLLDVRSGPEGSTFTLAFATVAGADAES